MKRLMQSAGALAILVAAVVSTFAYAAVEIETLRVTIDGTTYEAAGPVELLEVAPDAPAPAALEFLHWGTLTKAHDVYPRARAFAEFRDAGGAFVLMDVGTIQNAAPVHREVFGRAGGLITPDWGLTSRLERAGFRAAIADVEMVVMNDEAQGDASARNVRARELLEPHVPAGVSWTHGPFGYREQFGLERFASCTDASSWRFTYPWPEAPDWMLVEGAYGRATGVPLGYLVVELVAWHETMELAPPDTIVRAAQFAALQRPRFVGFYGWWRVYDDDRLRPTVARAIAAAREVSAAAGTWERAPADVVLVVNPDGWNYDATEKLHMLGGALGRRGVRFDLAMAGADVGGYAVVVDVLESRVNGAEHWWHPWSLYADPRRLDSRIHWRQHQGEEIADGFASEVVDAGAVAWTVDGRAAVEIFQTEGRRRFVIVNAAMEYPGPVDDGPYAGKSVAAAERVVVALPSGDREFELAPFGVEVVELAR